MFNISKLLYAKLKALREGACPAMVCPMLEFTFLHTSTVFLMNMHCSTIQMAPQKHHIFNISTENKAFLEPWNFMILALAEPPKWSPQDVETWLSTFALKPPRGSKFNPFRPPHNTKIIQTPQSNKAKSHTRKSWKSIGPKTLQKAPKSTFTKHQ